MHGAIGERHEADKPGQGACLVPGLDHAAARARLREKHQVLKTCRVRVAKCLANLFLYTLHLHLPDHSRVPPPGASTARACKALGSGGQGQFFPSHAMPLLLSLSGSLS